MEPQITPQAGGQPSAPSSNQPLDPSVVALTKAIGTAESGGNYNAGDNTGDNAASSGAYQFTPGFLQEWAPKAGVQYQAGQTLTPAQQDQIAYDAVQTMGTTGDPAYPELGKLTPAQIASAWNTGNPDAYLDPTYGQNNTYGSTENYVNKVAQDYQTNLGTSQSTQQTATPQQQSSSQPGWLDALEGLGVGALGWLGGQASNIGKDALEAGGAAVGGAVGDVPGAIVGESIGGGIASDLGLGGSGGNSQSTQTTQGTSDSSSGQSPAPEENLGQSTAASEAIKNAINENLQTTQSNRVFSQSQPGQDAINTAAMFGLINPDENGNLTYNKEKSTQVESELGDALDKVIGAEGGMASPVSVANYAGQYIGKDKFATASERQQASDMMQKELSAQGVPMNGSMPLSQMREAQKQHYASAKSSFGNPKSTPHMLAHKALGDAYGRTIRDNMKDKTLYDKVKKMQGNLINAKSIGKRLNGKKAIRNKGAWESFLKQAVRAAEIYLGDKVGGPIGAILGGMVGEHFNEKIIAHYGRHNFDTPGMRAALDIMKDTKPEVYKKIVEKLKGEIPEDISKKPKTKEGVAKEVAKDTKKIIPGLINIEKLNRKTIRGISNKE